MRLKAAESFVRIELQISIKQLLIRYLHSCTYAIMMLKLILAEL